MVEDSKLKSTHGEKIFDYPSTISSRSSERKAYTSQQEGIIPMDIEKYIDKIEQDRKDSEKHLREDRFQMETRIVEERRLSEQRMEERFNQVMAAVEKSNDKMDRLSDSVKADSTESKRWMIGLCITTIAGIAALVVTVVVK